MFRLSHKVSTTEDWTRIEDKLDRFQCNEGIGNPGDFCYDLSGLTYGVQYTSDVSALRYLTGLKMIRFPTLQLVYRLDTGEWSRHGNPLFFILVEAGKPVSQKEETLAEHLKEHETQKKVCFK